MGGLSAVIALGVFSLAQPAHAVVTLLTNSEAAFVAGFGLDAVSIAGADIAVATGTCHLGDGLCLDSAITAILGSILLDAQGQPTLTFEAMTDAAAQQMGVSVSEQQAFNQELDQVNSIAETIQQDTHARMAGQMSVKQASQIARTEWVQAEVALSPEAASAVEKVRQSL